jgi:hypothetical protein
LSVWSVAADTWSVGFIEVIIAFEPLARTMSGRSGLAIFDVVIAARVAAKEAKSLLFAAREARPPTAYMQLD